MAEQEPGELDTRPPSEDREGLRQREQQAGAAASPQNGAGQRERDGGRSRDRGIEGGSDQGRPEGEQGGGSAQNPADDQEAEPEPSRRWLGRVISAAIVLSALIVAAIVIRETNANPRTDDAEVFANYIGIAPQVDGPISELPVRDNQQVHRGEVLFEIDRRPYAYALERAQSDQRQLEGQIYDEQRTIRSQQSAAVAAAAGTRGAQDNVARAGSALEEAKADVGNAQAGLDRARAEYAYSLNNLHRVEPLLAKQFVTIDQVDQLRTGTAAKGLAVHQAEAQLAVAQARVQTMSAAYAQSLSQVTQSTAETRQSESAVRTLDPLTAQRQGRASAISNAEYNLNNCTVRAPFDARVTDLTLSEGAYAHTGQQVFTLIDTRTWWVIANFRETQLHRIRPGMAVDVYLMSRPEVHYNGVVESTGYGVTPDASTLGTLQPGLPDVQRTLSWVHLASRYPVRIRIEATGSSGATGAPAGEVFRIGESAVVVVRGFRGAGRG